MTTATAPSSTRYAVLDDATLNIALTAALEAVQETLLPAWGVIGSDVAVWTEETTQQPAENGWGWTDAYSAARSKATSFEGIEVGDLLVVDGDDARHGGRATTSGLLARDTFARYANVYCNLYVVVSRTAKRIRVCRVGQPTRYDHTRFGDDAPVLETMPRLGAETWGDSNARLVVNLGPIATIQARWETSEAGAAYRAAKARRAETLAEARIRQDAKDAAAKIAKAPLEAAVKQVNEALGFSLLTVSPYNDARSVCRIHTGLTLTTAQIEEILAGRGALGRITQERAVNALAAFNTLKEV